MLSKQTLSSKITLIFLALLLIFLAESKYRQWRSQKSIEAEKQNLQQQADALDKKNQELSQSLQYLNSASFRENIARQQLGLKKQGEQVYSFNDAPATDQTSASSRQNNPKKWWDYFFN